MLSWKIFMRAVRVILDDIGGALRISLVPYAILVAASLWFASSFGVLGIEEAMISGNDLPAIPDGYLSGILVVSLVQIVVSLWIAVAWHRRVLLRESVGGVVPPIHGRQMLAYLGRSILLGLIIGVVTVMISVALAPFLPGAAAALIVIFSTIIVYRLGLILPAGAIDRPIGLVESWGATKGQSLTVVLLALLTFAASMLLQVPTLLDAAMTGGPVEGAVAGPGPISIVYNLVIGWMLLLLGVSILSVLYGHFVERRPLD